MYYSCSYNWLLRKQSMMLLSIHFKLGKSDIRRVDRWRKGEQCYGCNRPLEIDIHLPNELCQIQRWIPRSLTEQDEEEFRPVTPASFQTLGRSWVAAQCFLRLSVLTVA